jgi:hypothetical protein
MDVLRKEAEVQMPLDELLDYTTIILYLFDTLILK